MKRSTSTRRGGRKGHRIQIQMTSEEKQDLKDFAAATGMSMNQVLRDLLLDPGAIEARGHAQHAFELLTEYRHMRECLSDLPPDAPGVASWMEEFLEIVVQATVAAGAKSREQLAGPGRRREPALAPSPAEREIHQLLAKAEASGLPLADQLRRELAGELRLRRLQ